MNLNSQAAMGHTYSKNASGLIKVNQWTNQQRPGTQGRAQAHISMNLSAVNFNSA